MHVRSVLEGKYFLTDLTIQPGALSSSNDGPTKNKNATASSYGAVIGTFCPLDWRLQKKNPSSVPMFRDVVYQSHHCTPNRVTMDIRKIAEKARVYDRTPPVGNKPHSLTVGGFVFHESRCGSTLVSNLLASASPERHRVYSESGPPLAVLRACEYKQCSKTKQQALLRDVVYLMGRSVSKRESHVFFKIQSVGVKSIRVVTETFPTTPWIFVFRDSIETMMSHLKHLSETKRANCLRALDNPPPILEKLVKDSGRAMESLNRPEFCAAHLVRGSFFLLVSSV